MSQSSGRSKARRGQQQHQSSAMPTVHPIPSASASYQSSSHPIDMPEDDPYVTPPPSEPEPHSLHSTAGDAFYDAFAQLELRINQASNLLAQVLRTLKHIKAHPADAEQMRPQLTEQLVSSGGVLDELVIMQGQFNSLKSRGKISSDEKSRRRQLREQANADIDKMRHNYSLISAAALQRTGEVPMRRQDAQHSRSQAQRQQKQQQRGRARGDSHEQGEYSDAQTGDEDAGRDSQQALLDEERRGRGGGGFSGLGGSVSSSATSTRPPSPLASLSLPPTYQTLGASESIGDLEGHLSMLLEEQRARADFMQQISRDVVQVHEMFQDVRYMVNAQQSMVDVIDDNIQRGDENARAALEQVQLAKQYQQAKRRKMCCLSLLGVLIIALAFLFIWVSFGDS